ncbi:cell surface glycoprotein CD200 receptor 1-B-like [Leptodactylus fuscus]|uniref:cell surface glycoprotein CD200 receptor 1-B-like n=1 Tax=Leptodactylus fuscus TaxID=238119 RepID=UPI003F4F267E
MNMFFLVLAVSILGCLASQADLVRVRRGRPGVLQCEADPGDTLLQVTWKLHLYHSSCIMSHHIQENNTIRSYSNCSPRMRSDNLSLTISNTDISDEGTYTCEVVNDAGTFFRSTELQVLAQPSTYLTLTSDGSPECGAIGGNPPAEISWIPHSHDINTTKLLNLDWTWSVISTYRSAGVNGTSVTCEVYHPTLEPRWTGHITLREGRSYSIILILGCVVTSIFIVTCLIIWKLPNIRAWFKTIVISDADRAQNDPEENKQDFEPYEIYTQKDNVIYSMASKYAETD